MNKLVKNKKTKNKGRFISFDTVTKDVTILTKDGTEQAKFSDIILLEESEDVTDKSEKGTATEKDSTVPDSVKNNVAQITALQAVLTNLQSQLTDAIEICDETKITNSGVFKTFQSSLNTIKTQLETELSKVQKEQK